MKTQLLLLAALIVLLTGGQAHALLDKTFTSSGQILPGEEWNSVYIYNDDTVVDMLGGLVEGMATYDRSTVNVTAGQVATLDAQEFSTANISGGEVFGPDAWDYSTINFYDGASAVNLVARDFGTVNMIAGITDYAGAGESGILNLFGGLVSDSLNAWDSATVNVFGYDLVKTSSGGTYGYGQVYGYWLDDTPFTINLSTAETYSRINLVPEPATLLLVTLGFLFVRKRR